MSPLSRYAQAILPHSQLTPAACGAIAVALEVAIERLAALDIRSPVLGRANEALRHLKRVATENSYGTSELELHRTARAIFLANDLYAITGALPPTGNKVFSEELARLARGTLEEDSRDQRGYAVQSQFWFGALLAHGGLEPKIPPGSGKRPDFIVNVEGVGVGVEVKRPISEDSSLELVDYADEQLCAYGVSGLIAVDLSEVLGTRLLTVPPQPVNSPDAARNRIRPEFLRVAGMLEDHIRGSQPVHHKRTIGLVTYARHCVWLDGDPLELDFGFFLRGKVFPNGSAGLLEHHAERFIDRLKPAVQRLTGSQLSD